MSNLKSIALSQSWAVLFFCLVNVGFAQEGQAPLSLAITPQENGVFTFKIGEEAARKLEGAVFENFSVQQQEGTFRFLATKSALRLTFGSVRNLSISIPKASSLSFRMNRELGITDFEVGKDSGNPVLFQLPDGSSSGLNAEARAQLELMKDQTFIFTGRGNGAVTNADGAAFPFSPLLPPLFGGERVMSQDTNGVPRMQKSTPVTQITVFGSPESEVNLLVGNKPVILRPGQKESVQGQNGSLITFSLNGSRKLLEWQAEKGAFRFDISGFECWHGLGLTGQKGALQWNLTGGVVQLMNQSSAGAFAENLLVNLSPQINVSLGSGATFLYGNAQDCGTFATSAYGGETILFNANSGQFTRLDEENVRVIGGLPSSTIASVSPQGSRTPVAVVWDGINPAELFGGGMRNKIIDGAPSELRTAGGGVLSGAMAETGKLEIKALQDSFLVEPELLRKLSIELPAQHGLTLSFDVAQTMLSVQADAQNTVQLVVNTPAGFAPLLPPGAKLNFVLGRNSFLLASGQDGTLTFTEAAGSDNVNPFSLVPVSRASPTGRRNTFDSVNDFLDTSRVFQPPVSTFE
ncbi:MAG: hypothetical protein SFY81_08010 [Verrucomicrobiota bacterium]|nr:hypothetical protein [Verrucomicrobiota bacterium]